MVACNRDHDTGFLRNAKDDDGATAAVAGPHMLAGLFHTHTHMLRSCARARHSGMQPSARG